jgi:two-component system LytT family response regulator
LLRETMTSLERKLDPAKFLRIHRSRIVRTSSILELRSIDNREFTVKLSDGSEHRSSRTYADQLEGWLSAAKSWPRESEQARDGIVRRGCRIGIAPFPNFV